MIIQCNNPMAQQRNLESVSINRLQRKHIQRNNKNRSPRTFAASTIEVHPIICREGTQV